MKKLIVLLLAFTFFSCSKSDKPQSSNADKTKEPVEVSKETPKESPKAPDPNDPNKNIYGYYSGDFKAVKYNENKDISYINRITISLDSIINNSVYGHSVVAGNNRPFKGTYNSKGNELVVDAKEPGDDKYDGTFSFTVRPASNEITGKWTSFNKNSDVTVREYDLKKKEFTYNSDLKMPEDVAWTFLYDQNAKKFETEGEKGESLTEDVIKVNASKKLLTKNEVENMHKGDLEIIRNSIYARHGYSFKNRRIRFVFDQYVDWYMPVSTDVSKELTEVEQKNIDLLKRYEQHAEKYYDDFGR
ncbi:hypothetical protein BH10BAC5_BH10BAC5_01890 [soil metagenome]